MNIQGQDLVLVGSDYVSGSSGTLWVGRVMVPETVVVQAGSEIILPGRVVMNDQYSCKVLDVHANVLGVVDKDDNFVDRSELCVT